MTAVDFESSPPNEILRSSPTVRLVIRRITTDLTETGLSNLLKDFDILDLHYVVDRHGKNGMNCAYITVLNQAIAADIIDKLHMKEPLKMIVEVNSPKTMDEPMQSQIPVQANTVKDSEVAEFSEALKSVSEEETFSFNKPLILGEKEVRVEACGGCGKEASLVCGWCNRASYCGVDCQALEWPQHFNICVDDQGFRHGESRDTRKTDQLTAGDEGENKADVNDNFDEKSRVMVPASEVEEESNAVKFASEDVRLKDKRSQPQTLLLNSMNQNTDPVIEIPCNNEDYNKTGLKVCEPSTKDDDEYETINLSQLNQASDSDSSEGNVFKSIESHKSNKIKTEESCSKVSTIEDSKMDCIPPIWTRVAGVVSAGSKGELRINLQDQSSHLAMLAGVRLKEEFSADSVIINEVLTPTESADEFWARAVHPSSSDSPNVQTVEILVISQSVKRNLAAIFCDIGVMEMTEEKRGSNEVLVPEAEVSSVADGDVSPAADVSQVAGRVCDGARVTLRGLGQTCRWAAVELSGAAWLEELLASHSSSPHRVTAPLPGQQVLVRGGGDRLVRAELVRLGGEAALCQLLDLPGQVEVGLEELFHPPHRVLSMPPLCPLLELAGLPDLSTAGCPALLQQTGLLNRVFTLRLVEGEGEESVVELLDTMEGTDTVNEILLKHLKAKNSAIENDGVLVDDNNQEEGIEIESYNELDLGSKIENKSLAKSIEEEEISKETCFTMRTRSGELHPRFLTSYQVLPLGCALTATILHVESPSCLFVCSSEQFGLLLQFQDYLQSLQSVAQEMGAVKQSVPLRQAQLVLFQSGQDQCWYRGIITKIGKAAVRVYCVDYGFFEIVQLEMGKIQV